MQSPSPGSEKTLWGCLQCSGHLHAIDGKQRCDACGKEYPVVQGVPILLRDPIEYLRSELASLDRAERAAAQRRTAIDTDAAAAGLTEASVNRHRDVVDTDIARVQALRALLKPTLDALRSLPAEPQNVAAKRSGWGFDSLFPYLLRDWTGTEELRAAASVIGGAIADAFPVPTGKAIAFAGCGAAGIFDEIALDFEHVVGFDLTFPILAAARSLLDGNKLQIPMPRAISDSGSLVLERRRSAANAGRIQLAAMDAFETAFAADSIDCIVTSFLLDLLPDPRKLANEIHRVLTPDGIWINYGPSGPLQSLWRFDESEGGAFLQAAGFRVLDSKAVRATYLDLSRDCPSWTFQNHVCYLTTARKTKGGFAIPDSGMPVPGDLLDLIPEHHRGAALIAQQSLLGERGSRVLFRYERFPGRSETFEVNNDAARILELIDGRRNVKEIARLAEEIEPPRPHSETVRAIAQFLEQHVLRSRTR